MLKVAAYARVSTDKEDQINSLTNQREYFESYIKSKDDWEFVKVYFDEGITGTQTKKRKGFNRMIDDCKNGKIDLILTKEVSRFARNTVDTLNYTRMLKEYDVGVFFINDNIDTRQNDGESFGDYGICCTGRKPKNFRTCEMGTKTCYGKRCCVRK